MTSDGTRRMRAATTVELTIDNPPLNVLTLACIEDLAAAAAAAHESAASLLVIRGSGGTFSAGVDVAAHAPALLDRMLTSFHGLIRQLWRVPQVTLAVVEGVALGGGCELAASCDLVLAAADARFAQPEIDVGCFGPVAAAILPERIGHQRASELMYLGRPMTAADAAAAGLVNWVSPGAEIDSRLAELAASFAAKSAVVLRHTREIIVGPRRRAWEERLEAAERVYRERLAATHDMAEGVTAFMDKRPPSWKNR